MPSRRVTSPARRARVSLLVGAGLLVASSSAAQPADKPLAEALFRDGRDAMANGDIHGACRKFEASERIEPKIGTLLNLATCHELEGRTATAWAEFNEAIPRAVRADQPDRAQIARDHAAALEKRLSRLQLAGSLGTAGL